MTTFYKNFVRLCVENGYSESGAAKAIGLSNAAATGWKKGKVPSNTTKEKLSRLFNIPVEALTADDGVPPSVSAHEKAPVGSESADRRSKEFAELFIKLNDAEKDIVLAQLRGLAQGR